MADRVCIHCGDQGNCDRCSWFFEPGKIHVRCGRPWGEHDVRSQPFYAPYAVCRSVTVRTTEPAEEQP